MVAATLVACGGVEDGLDTGFESATAAASARAGAAVAGTMCPASASRGDYCGSNGIVNGSANTLYTCTGPGSTATVKRSCPTRCLGLPAGYNDLCARPLRMLRGADVLWFGNYDTSGRLLWEDFGTSHGGKNLPGAQKSGAFTRMETRDANYLYQCTDFVQGLSENLSSQSWYRGRRVTDNCSSIPSNTVVATFTGPTTYGGHVGFKRGCTSTSVQLFDQNYVATQLIGRSSINATNYYEVMVVE